MIEGTGEKNTDTDTIARIAAVWAAEGWPCNVDASGTGLTAPFNAPGQGCGAVVRVLHHSAVGDIGRDDRAGWRDAPDFLSN